MQETVNLSMRVSMQGCGADQLVVARKAGNAAGAKELGQIV